MKSRAPAGGEQVVAPVMLADELGGKGHDAQHAPSEGMGYPDEHGDRHEQRGAKPEPPEPRQPQPKAAGEESEGHRQREISEAADEGIAVRQRQREDNEWTNGNRSRRERVG